jgi:adenosylmethionine-8-amino-7-oxononanoate aminotransferase
MSAAGGELSGVGLPRADPRVDDLLLLDAAHVWHPYAPLPAARPALLVDSAQGVRITLRDGRELVDGMSSWWAAIHGYRHPALDAAAHAQIDHMAHVMFGGLTHEPAITLAQRLVDLAPPGLDRVFFSDSGSVAVEVAIKLVAQYWQARGHPAKRRLLTIRGGYHGDTVGAMSVCDPVTGMHHLFGDVVQEQAFAPRPPGGIGAPVDEEWASAFESILATYADELAAVIVEPVVQGAGGMWFYDPAYVRLMRDQCDRHDVLLILDEIATGFGRTGAFFAADLAGVNADVMCVGKALTGGYLTMAATLCTAEVATIVSGGEAAAFMHGPTFMANPLAAAVAGANLDLLSTGAWKADVARIEAELADGLGEVRGREGVTDVRVLGAIGVVELDAPVDIGAATTAAVAAGVWLRPFGRLIYVMPPYVCTSNDVERICLGVRAAVDAVTG